jgi:HEPN domain-containing protein
MVDSLDVTKWIRFAQDDFDLALIASERFRPFIEGACYHCQQAAEKILKAYTLAQTGSRTKSHELEDLLDACVLYSAEFNNLRNACKDLEPYTILARYPADIEPTEYHMKKALKDADAILTFTKSELKKLGYEYNNER